LRSFQILDIKLSEFVLDALFQQFTSLIDTLTLFTQLQEFSVAAVDSILKLILSLFRLLNVVIQLRQLGMLLFFGFCQPFTLTLQHMQCGNQFVHRPVECCDLWVPAKIDDFS
jgi:hypothetical protein